jgi:S1-C subfamily serine protease
MKYEQNDPRDPNIYRTGSTTPPKKHSRLVAILMVLVVLLAGLVSILSVLNIQLFSSFNKLQQAAKVPLSLEIGHYPEQNMVPSEAEGEPLSGSKSVGIQGDTVTPVYQKHFRLPEGLFITHVTENSTAWQQGILEGDVLISLNGVPITGENCLRAFLDTRAVGDECIALIYRMDTDKTLRIPLTIEQSES